MKLAGKRSAGNPHAAFDEAGAGNGVDDPLEGDNRPKGENQFGLTRSRTATAPVLDPTCERLGVKVPWSTHLGGDQGRMISAQDRRKAVELIKEAQSNGARLLMACMELGISIRTLCYFSN